MKFAQPPYHLRSSRPRSAQDRNKKLSWAEYLARGVVVVALIILLAWWAWWAWRDDLIDSSYSIAVDYSKSLEEMISASKYTKMSKEITTERFPVADEGQVETEIILVHFDFDPQDSQFQYNLTSYYVIKEMEQRGLVPAKIEHLLALGAEHPDLRCEFPIIALGSIWLDPYVGTRVPCLYYINDDRQLTLMSDPSGWGKGPAPLDPTGWRKDIRFAAVPK